MPSARCLVTLLPVALSALALGACGGSSGAKLTVDSSSLTLTGTDGRPIPMTGLACEDVDKPEVGAPVACTARNPAGSKLEIAAKLSSVEGGRGRITGTVTRALVDGEKIAAQVRKALADQPSPDPTNLTCPKEIPVPTATPARCEVVAPDGERATVAITIDAKGELSYDVGANG